MVSAGLEDKAIIKGNLSSMLPTELSGSLLERAPNLKIDQSVSKFYYKRL